MKNTDEIKHEPDIKSMSAEELEKLSSALLKKQEELSKKENELNELNISITKKTSMIKLILI